LGEINAALDGHTYETDDPGYHMSKHMARAAGKDPDCLRAFVRIAAVLDLPEVVLADAALTDKIMTLGADWRDEEYAGPSRDELVKLATG
jgi:hypothetical protein